jgi:hypothetical protein
LTEEILTSFDDISILRAHIYKHRKKCARKDPVQCIGQCTAFDFQSDGIPGDVCKHINNNHFNIDQCTHHSRRNFTANVDFRLLSWDTLL